MKNHMVKTSVTLAKAPVSSGNLTAGRSGITSELKKPLHRLTPLRKLTLSRREALSGYAYAALPLLGFAVFYVVPFGITVMRTFSGGTSGFIFVGLDNYAGINTRCGIFGDEHCKSEMAVGVL